MSADRVQIQLLGRFSLRREEREVDRLRTRKTEGLLAWLALHRGVAFSRPSLVERFWPEEDEANARRKLRLALHSIRQEVGEALETVRDSVVLRGAWVDVLDLDAPTGEILPELDFDWLPGVRADHAIRVEGRLRTRLEEQLAAKSLDAASETLYALLERDPYEPRWYEILHRTLLSRGRRGEARSVAGIARNQLGTECPPSLAEVSAPGPTPRRSFVGRSRILGSLVESLLGDREPAAAILIGPGGIGKTRIAQEVAHLAKREEIEVRFVRLIGLVSETEVRTAVLEALRPPGTEGPVEAFEVTSLPPTLVVLDNCEQVSEAAARWLATLVQRGSSLRVLLTSQVPLPAFPAEAFPVPALPPASASDLASVLRSEACQLFAMEAEVDLDGETAPAVAEICRKMGGVPLAIRHVAARLASTTLDGLLRSLETYEGAGERVGSDLDPRHRSVAGCVRWSLALGTERQREQLRTLALFADAFRSETTAGLGIPPAEFDELVRLNWVVKRFGEDAHEILPPFREVLRANLEPEVVEAFRDAMTGHVAHRIATELQPRYGSLLESLAVHTRDLQDLFAYQLDRGRLDLAEVLFTALYHVKLRRGDLDGARADGGRFFAAVPREARTQFPTAANLYASAVYFQRDMDLAEEFYLVAAAGPDKRLRGVADANLGLVAMRRRDYDKAIVHLQRVLDDPGIPQRSLESRRLNLAECHLGSGRPEVAEAIALESLATLPDDPQLRHFRALTLLVLAETAAVRLRDEEARDWAERALTLFASEDQRLRVSECRFLLGYLAAVKGDREGLREQLQGILAIDEEGLHRVLAFGICLHAFGETELAEPFLRGIDWLEAPVWAELRCGRLAKEVPPGAGMRHTSREEWRLRAEEVIKRL
ncbi:MAG: ATP-binding protein [Fimbriimonas sp.]